MWIAQNQRSEFFERINNFPLQSCSTLLEVCREFKRILKGKINRRLMNIDLFSEKSIIQSIWFPGSFLLWHLAKNKKVKIDLSQKVVMIQIESWLFFLVLLRKKSSLINDTDIWTLCIKYLNCLINKYPPKITADCLPFAFHTTGIWLFQQLIFTLAACSQLSECHPKLFAEFPTGNS